MESKEEQKAQIETAIQQMVDFIEEYFGAVVFEFINSQDAAPGFGRNLDQEFDRWMRILQPGSSKIQNQMQGGDTGLAWDVRLFSMRTGFYLGVLMGCKYMGATREELMKKGQALVLYFQDREEAKEATAH